MATQDGTVWMTITPNEINTMAQPIGEASGRVLTLGLGLGYFAYMAHRKPDVEPYLMIKTTARRFKKMKMSYWIEDSLLWSLTRFVLPVLDAGFRRAVHEEPDKSVNEAVNINPKTKALTAFVQRLTSRDVIDAPQKLRDLFTVEHMEHLLRTRKNVMWPGA